MRLVCPNCSAQYEIDGSMIPDEGRDVQCSNCGHTWFELPPAGGDFDDLGREDFESPLAQVSDDDDLAEPEPGPSEADQDSQEDEPPAPEASDLVEEPEAQDDKSEDGTEPEEIEDEDGPSIAAQAVSAAASDDEDDDDVEDEFEVETTTLKPRRPADAAALDILKEEAQRELSQRRAPPSEAIETQTDLGLDEVRNRHTPSRALRARMAHLGEEEPETRVSTPPEPEKPAQAETEAQDDDDYTEPRRDLLPDIDEINSTLKSTRKRSAPGPEELAQKRSGFRAGFLLVLLVVVAMIFTYAQAPAIARALPETETALLSYVDLANGVRDWIDALVGGS